MNDDKLTEKLRRLSYEFSSAFTEREAKEIIQLVRDSEWISRDDELPEKDQRIIICVDKRVDPQAVFLHKVARGEESIITPRVREAIVREVGNEGEGNYIETQRDSYEDPNHITHWRPIPSPPSTKAAK